MADDRDEQVQSDGSAVAEAEATTGDAAGGGDADLVGKLSALMGQPSQTDASAESDDVPESRATEDDGDNAAGDGDGSEGQADDAEDGDAADPLDNIPDELIDVAQQRGITRADLGAMYSASPKSTLRLLLGSGQQSRPRDGNADQTNAQQGQQAAGPKLPTAEDFARMFAKEHPEEVAKEMGKDLYELMAPSLKAAAEAREAAARAQAQTQQAQQQAEVAAARKAVFDDSKHAHFYAKTGGRKAVENRENAELIADIFMAGARAKGIPVSAAQAFQFGHMAVAFDHTHTTARKEITRQVVDRSQQRSIPPSGARAPQKKPPTDHDRAVSSVDKVLKAAQNG